MAWHGMAFYRHPPAQIIINNNNIILRSSAVTPTTLPNALGRTLAIAMRLAHYSS